MVEGALSMKKALFGVLVLILLVIMTARSKSNPGIANAAPPFATSLPAQEVQIKMAAGLVIEGTFYPSSASNPAPAVPLFHQYNGNRGQWDALTTALPSIAYTVLVVDQPGFPE